MEIPSIMHSPTSNNIVNSLHTRIPNYMNHKWDTKFINCEEGYKISDFLCINNTSNEYYLQNEPLLNYEFDIPESPESLIEIPHQPVLTHSDYKCLSESMDNFDVISDNKIEFGECSDDRKQCYLENIGDTNNWNINYTITGKNLCKNLLDS